MEMVGSDGPGDKLFRLIGSESLSLAVNPLSVHDPMIDPRLDMSMGSQFAMQSQMDPSLNNDMLWNSDAHLFNRFRSFPRDEGSQLDKVRFSLVLSSLITCACS